MGYILLFLTKWSIWNTTESLIRSQHDHLTHQLLNGAVKHDYFRDFMGARRLVLVLDTDP